MKYDAFLGEVQHRLGLATEGEAAKMTRIVLNTQGERLGEGEASDLAAGFPMEIDRHLTEPTGGQQFSSREFVERVAERSEIDEADAQFYAQAVVALVGECVPESELEQVRTQFPDDYEELFEFARAAAMPW